MYECMRNQETLITKEHVLNFSHTNSESKIRILILIKYKYIYVCVRK
jgi:hypothetical protein